MLGQQPVEQHLVAVAHVGQEHVLGQIIGLASVLGVHPPQLALQCGYAAGQQALQPQQLALLRRERGAAIEHGIG